MSAISSNNSFEQPVGPVVTEKLEQAVGPVVEEPTSEVQDTTPGSSSFDLSTRKFYPFTRFAITGDWNGSLCNLSAVKKVLTCVIAFLTSLTSIVTVPLIALQNMKIKAFNLLPTQDKVNKTLTNNIDDVVNTAKAYQRSPDSHKLKLALEEKNRTLGETLDKIKIEFPEEAPQVERMIREQIEMKLGSALISIKPQSSQDQHRFTYPLAKLVLDGFYPMINGRANPFVKGVSPESITYQFEDGVFAPSKERIINNFFAQSEIDPQQAFDDLEIALKNIQRPTQHAADEVRLAIRQSVADKLNHPSTPQFQKFVAASRHLLEQGKFSESDQIMSREQLQELSSSLVTSKILSKGQAEVFLAQVQGDLKGPSLFEVEAKAKQHQQTARKTAWRVAALSGAAILGKVASSESVIEYAKQIAPDLVAKASGLLTMINPTVLAYLPHAAAVTGGAMALYGLYHGYKSMSGPKITIGQEAARSYAIAVESRKEVLDKVRDVEFQAFEAAVVEDESAVEIATLKQSLIEADALVEKAGHALEAAGKNPTPKLIEKATVISTKAASLYEQIKKKADVLEAAVKKALAQAKVLPPSYTDLSAQLSEAQKILKRVNNRLEGAEGLSNKGGRKLDDLQKSLQKKVKELADFEKLDLAEVRAGVERVKVLEAEIEKVLVEQKAKPAKAKTWAASLVVLHQDLAKCNNRIQEVNEKHSHMKNEIAQMRELITLMGSAPSA